MNNDKLVDTLHSLCKRLAKGKMDGIINISNEELRGLDEAVYIIDRTKNHPKKCQACGSDNLIMTTKPIEYIYECQKCYWRMRVPRSVNFLVADALGEVENLMG